jgi:hypothetical protein
MIFRYSIDSNLKNDKKIWKIYYIYLVIPYG